MAAAFIASFTLFSPGDPVNTILPVLRWLHHSSILSMKVAMVVTLCCSPDIKNMSVFLHLYYREEAIGGAGQLVDYRRYCQVHKY